MHFTPKFFRNAALGLAAVLGLSGCLDIQGDVAIRKDGSDRVIIKTGEKKYN